MNNYYSESQGVEMNLDILDQYYRVMAVSGERSLSVFGIRPVELVPSDPDQSTAWEMYIRREWRESWGWEIGGFAAEVQRDAREEEEAWGEILEWEERVLIDSTARENEAIGDTSAWVYRVL